MTAVGSLQVASQALHGCRDGPLGRACSFVDLVLALLLAGASRVQRGHRARRSRAVVRQHDGGGTPASCLELGDPLPLMFLSMHGLLSRQVDCPRFLVAPSDRRTQDHVPGEAQRGPCFLDPVATWPVAQPELRSRRSDARPQRRGTAMEADVLPLGAGLELGGGSSRAGRSPPAFLRRTRLLPMWADDARLPRGTRRGRP